VWNERIPTALPGLLLSTGQSVTSFASGYAAFATAAAVNMRFYPYIMPRCTSSVRLSVPGLKKPSFGEKRFSVVRFLRFGAFSIQSKQDTKLQSRKTSCIHHSTCHIVFYLAKLKNATKYEIKYDLHLIAYTNIKFGLMRFLAC